MVFLFLDYHISQKRYEANIEEGTMYYIQVYRAFSRNVEGLRNGSVQGRRGTQKHCHEQKLFNRHEFTSLKSVPLTIY